MNCSSCSLDTAGQHQWNCPLRQVIWDTWVVPQTHRVMIDIQIIEREAA